MVGMEKRLQDLIFALKVASDVENLDTATPILMRHSNSAINKTVAIICSEFEPDQMVLPLNVVWFVFDKQSQYYNMALKRTSKDPDPNGEYTHSWKLLYYYDECMEGQWYDEEDQGHIGDAQKVPVATTDVFGIVKLHENPPEGEDPHVILDDDARLSDARPPLDHSHAEIPASMLKHSTGTITIADGSPEIGMTIVAEDALAAKWRKLTEDDIEPSPSNP